MKESHLLLQLSMLSAFTLIMLMGFDSFTDSALHYLLHLIQDVFECHNYYYYIIRSGNYVN